MPLEFQILLKSQEQWIMYLIPGIEKNVDSAHLAIFFQINRSPNVENCENHFHNNKMKIFFINYNSFVIMFYI